MGILWRLAKRYMDQIEALSEIYTMRWVPASIYIIGFAQSADPKFYKNQIFDKICFFGGWF